MTGCGEGRTGPECLPGFAGNWLSGAADSRSLRRRLMAVLRMAHRVLGMGRKGLGLGTLGGGGGGLRSASMIGGLAALVALGLSAPAQAQYQAGGGTATGGGTVAVGVNATASQLNAIAIGIQATASAVNSINIGARTTPGGAVGESAIAFGTDVTASANDATAIGRASQATQVRSIAIGAVARATGTSATAMGDAAKAWGNQSIALGLNAVAGVQANTAIPNSIAIGTNAVSSAGFAVALGQATQATADFSTAVGNGATASADSATALGRETLATGVAATAVGNSARATGNTALALGGQAVAVGDSTVAVGQGAGAGSTTANTGSVAMGIAAGTLVSGAQNTAVGGGIASVMRGAGSGVTGTRNLAMGTGDGSVTYDGTLAASAGNLVTGSDNIAIGTNAGIGVASNATTSIGYNAMATAGNTIAVGPQASASALNAIAMGNSTVADAEDAVAIGNGSTATGGKAVSIGSGNIASGDGAVAIGDPNTAFGDGAIAQGKDNTANGNGSVAMGNTNMVGGGGQAISTPGTPAQGAVGIGYQNTVIGQGSVAIGSTSSALAAGAVAFGDTAVANFADDVALGSGSTTAAAVATASAAINGTTYNFAGTNPTSTVSVGVLGAERTITNVAAGRISGASTDAVNGSQLFATNQAVDSLATTVNNINTGGGIKYFHANSLLPDSQALGTDSVAIGPNAVANNAGDVAIGLNSVSGVTTPVPGATIGGTAYSFAGTTPAGAFSVGSLGAERQIQNVAAGQLSGSSTDAVNGSQLFATNQQVTQNTTDIADLDNAITNIAGDTSTAYTDANGDGIRYVRTNDRTLPVADSSAQGIGSTAVGYQATAVADNSLALGRDSEASILGGVALGSGSISDRALAPATGQLPAGSAVIEYNTTDKTLLGAVSVGTDTAYRQITNVADGTNAQDAVTIRQLQGAIAAVATTPSMYFHANSTAGDSLAVGAESIAVGPTTVVNGDNGIGIGNGAIVDQIAPGGTAIGQDAHVMLADGIALGTNSRSAGIQSVAIGAGAQSNHANSVALGAGSVTQATVATSSTTINGQTYNFAGAAPVGTVSVGDAGAERTITNVAAGRISADSTDAINGSQLYATNQALDDLSDQIGDVGEVAKNAVTYETVTNADGSVTKLNKITLQGGDPSAPVVISNVGAGVANTDAVNVAQLNEAKSFAIETANDYTDQVAATTLIEANDYTDQKFDELNQAIGDVQDEARQAAAVGLAAASLRYDDRPGKVSVSMGGGYWRSEGALAFGAGYTSESGRVRANLSGVTAGGDWGVGAGVSLTLN